MNVRELRDVDERLIGMLLIGALVITEVFGVRVFYPLVTEHLAPTVGAYAVAVIVNAIAAVSWGLGRRGAFALALLGAVGVDVYLALSEFVQ